MAPEHLGCLRESPELVSYSSKGLERKQPSNLGPEAKKVALTLGPCAPGTACLPWGGMGRGKGHSSQGSLRATSPVAPGSH